MLAQQRLKKLKTKLERDNQHESDYKMFIEDMITKGYAEAVPATDLVTNYGKVWYIPHHGSLSSKKTKKVESCIWL